MKYLKLALILIILSCLWIPISSSIDYATIEKAVIAEAAGEGYEGMYGVACCFRNRLNKGMGLGSAGLRRKDLDEFIAKQTPEVRLNAKLVVYSVFVLEVDDITRGATHFANLDECNPYWMRAMVITVIIGKHHFMKEKK